MQPPEISLRVVENIDGDRLVRVQVKQIMYSPETDSHYLLLDPDEARKIGHGLFQGAHEIDGKGAVQ